MSDDKKLTLTGRTLGVGKGVETGQVRQSFSHGRSKAVVVERKKKRVLTPGTTPAPTGRPDAPAPAAPRAYVPKKAGGDAGGNATLTDHEHEMRIRVLEEANRRKEEEERRAAEEAARREAEEVERKKREAAAEAARAAAREEAGADAAAEDEEEARHRAEAEADAKRRAADLARKREAEEAARKANEEAAAKEKAGEEARKKADLEARAVQLKKASEARQLAGDEEEAERGRRGGAGKRAPGGTPKKTRSDDDRRRGRLSVNRNFDDEDTRQRSLAAFKRAQMKNKRRVDTGPTERQAREVVIPETITVQELANRMAEKATAVIKCLMGMGVMATINQVLDQDTAQLVVEEFGNTPKRVSDADVEIGLFGEADVEADLESRAPIVTVMGHVDHGKTSLLDALRSANVVSGEAGGITQHIGAYQVAMDNGSKITFLDTPGHAAFTQMRARGASVTDIVILVVAADDGVMPQTIEAIHHAKAAGVPMIVAINKMDKPGVNPDRVRQELLQHEVVVETFSGETQEVEVSAKTGAGLDKLKEAIILQAEILELKANPNRTAEGVVVEAKLDKGRGSVATVLVQRGTLRQGDIFVAGPEWGRVRALVNDRGEQVETAGPSQPVEVVGLQGTPGAGDDFSVVDSEARAREITSYRQAHLRQKRQAAAAAPKTLESMFSQLKESNETMTFDVVLKGDVQGSVEAITQALEKAGNDQIRCRVLHGAVGGITETDITLAHASNALVIGFNVRPNKQARELAEHDGVAIKYYSVIYHLIDDVKAAMAGELGPEFDEKIIGRAEIRDVFQAGKSGKAAGCLVVEGTIKRDAKARILRDDVIVYEGEIDNLRRFKDDVKEVGSGQECGLTFENFQDMRAGDFLEVYELIEIERTL
ncbi:translation initiation factor IF-2 [Pseudokordiimonas caeni]|uniref:translation initiation factor IF-2 n=1 Tax=Pseudokordiimonas caeni TaxID=2997908 RepID=UPI002810F84E|nr:translation initiation factor IF-2 [Pseudokordiimonas caeni]